MEARQVDPRFRYQRRQPGNEVEGSLVITDLSRLQGLVTSALGELPDIV